MINYDLAVINMKSNKYEEAKEKLELGIKEKDPRCVFLKAWMIKYGQGYKKDNGRANKLFNSCFEGIKEMADKGDTSAIDLMMEFYLKGLGKIKPDSSKYKKYLNLLAKTGGLEELCAAGEVYLVGNAFVECNLKKGISYLTKAAKGGNSSAQRRLGNLYLDGYLVPKSAKKGRYWLEQAAIQMDADAQYDLYRIIDEDEKDLANYWLWKAYENGSKEAGGAILREEFKNDFGDSFNEDFFDLIVGGNKKRSSSTCLIKHVDDDEWEKETQNNFQEMIQIMLKKDPAKLH